MSEPNYLNMLDKLAIDTLATYFAPGVSVDVGDIEITFIDDKTIRFRSASVSSGYEEKPDAFDEEDEL